VLVPYNSGLLSFGSLSFGSLSFGSLSFGSRADHGGYRAPRAAFCNFGGGRRGLTDCLKTPRFFSAFRRPGEGGGCRAEGVTLLRRGTGVHVSSAACATAEVRLYEAETSRLGTSKRGVHIPCFIPGVPGHPCCASHADLGLLEDGSPHIIRL
jgi:hypothetical protein